MYNDCLTPLYVPYKENGQKGFLRVRCGKCLTCKIQRTSEWMIRLYMESHYWKHISHLTLTYSDDFLPVAYTDIKSLYCCLNEEVPSDQNGDDVCPVPTLYPRDMQLFLKRLRKSGLGEYHFFRKSYRSGNSLDCIEGEWRTGLRFYGCGEYGNLRGRSHLHIILFGVQATVQNQELIRKIWGKGRVCLKPCFPETFGYVAGYVQKKLYGEKSNPFRVPEFLRCSQKIGQDWFEDNIGIFDEEHLYIPFQGQGGKSFKYAIPRYFRKQLIELGIIKGVSVPALIEMQKLEFRDLAKHCQAQGLEIGDFFRQRFKDVSHKFAKRQKRRNLTGDI